MATGQYDKASLEVINLFVREGFVCFDVGANIGALTLAMAVSAGAKGQVHAFEPGPPTFCRLKQNLALNPHIKNRVVPIQIGLSAVPGQLLWAEDMNNRGNAGLLGGEGVLVPISTVDDYVSANALTRLDFVKIDVEGMEFEVLRGGLQTWQRFRPVLYFETLSAFEVFRKRPLFSEIELMLQEIGYSLFKVVNGEPVGTTAVDLGHNTLALPGEPRSS